VCLAVLFPRNTELNNTFQGWYWGYLDGKWGLVPCTHLEDEMGDSGLPAWEAAVPFTVTLDLDFASISSPEEYKTEFIKDIAFASNTAEVFFKFAGLRAGSIINEMLVAHGGGNPDSIIQGLIKQLDDPNSCLMQGKWTRKSIAIDPATKLGGSVLSEPSVVVGQVKSAHDNHEALEVSRIQNAKGPEKNHGVEKYMVPQDSSDYSPQSVRAAKVSHSPTEKEQETAARTPEQASQPENRIGIGVALAKAEKGVFIAEIRPGSAAFQAGLQVGELLESIDEQPLEGLELSNVVSMLRGPPGSSIKVESHGRGTSNQTEATNQAGVSSVRPLTDDFGDDEENCYESMPGSRGLARARALHLLRLNRTRQAKKMSSQSVPARAEWQQDGNDPFRESALSWTSDITPRTLVTSASEPAGTTSAPDMAEIIDTYDASERVIYDSVTSAPDIYDSVSVMYDDVPFAHGMDNVLVHPPTHQEVLSPGMRPACATRAACTFNAAAHAVAF